MLGEEEKSVVQEESIPSPTTAAENLNVEDEESYNYDEAYDQMIDEELDLGSE